MVNKNSAKDENYREFALTASPFLLVLKLCMPLALYQAFIRIFKIFDNILASQIGTNAVSAVACMGQITAMITAIGTGLAVGGSIRIAEAYGKGDYALVSKRVAILYTLAIGISAFFAITLLPFAEQFLRFFNTPETLIHEGLGYFRIEIATLLISFFNTTYIAVERSRGHTTKILALNFGMLVVKLTLSIYFVYGIKGGLNLIAIATFMGQLVVTVAAIIQMRRDEGAFRYSLRNLTLDKRNFLPIVQTSYPISLEKMLFSSGKVIVNSMAALYGDIAIGALSISNNLGALTTSWQEGFSDGTSALVSQNRGAKKYRRVLQIFESILVINLVIGIVGVLVVRNMLPWLADLYVTGNTAADIEFRNAIITIHQWEMFGYITLGIHSAVAALLLGCGYTKRTMLINGMRVFVYRIPVLWLFQHFTTLGIEAVGLTMMISNICTGVTALIAVIPTVIKLKQMIKAEELNNG